MQISWTAVIMQALIIGLIILFIFSFYSFIKGMVQRSKVTNETLRRLEQKIDTLIVEQKNQKQ